MFSFPQSTLSAILCGQLDAMQAKSQGDNDSQVKTTMLDPIQCVVIQDVAHSLSRLLTS